MTLRDLLAPCIVFLLATAAGGQELVPGQFVEREISAPLVFTIALRDGEFAGLQFENRGGDFTARMLAPGGELVEFYTPQQESDRETEGFVAPAGGVYRLKISPAYRNASARLGVRLT